MAKKQRTTFAKLQKERARREKQAAKRARRHGDSGDDSIPAPLSATPPPVPSAFQGDEAHPAQP